MSDTNTPADILRKAIRRVEDPAERNGGLGWETACEVLRRLLNEIGDAATEPPITYRVQPEDITSLTWPMWEACGIECPKMIGAACPADEAHFRKTCPGWSGKFPSAAAEVVHGWTMTSDQSDTCGETDAPFGWNALFRNPDRGTHDGPMGAGLILHTNSPGSVVLNRYESVEALDEVWADLQEREAEYDRANCVECADGHACPEHCDCGEC